MTFEGRLERRADIDSMFGIVAPGSEQARRNLATQRRVAQTKGIRETPLWEPADQWELADPNRKRPAGIIRVR